MDEIALLSVATSVNVTTCEVVPLVYKLNEVVLAEKLLITGSWSSVLVILILMKIYILLKI